MVRSRGSRPVSNLSVFSFVMRVALRSLQIRPHTALRSTHAHTLVTVAHFCRPFFAYSHEQITQPRQGPRSHVAASASAAVREVPAVSAVEHRPSIQSSVAAEPCWPRGARLRSPGHHRGGSGPLETGGQWKWTVDWWTGGQQLDRWSASLTLPSSLSAAACCPPLPLLLLLLPPTLPLLRRVRVLRPAK